MPRKRTKKEKPYILSRQTQTPQKTANKSLKTQATQQSTQAKRKNTTKKQRWNAPSVSKTDETAQTRQNGRKIHERQDGWRRIISANYS